MQRKGVIRIFTVSELGTKQLEDYVESMLRPSNVRYLLKVTVTPEFVERARATLEIAKELKMCGAIAAASLVNMGIYNAFFEKY